MILKLLLNTQMIWVIFMKVLKNAIQKKKKKKKRKTLLVFDDMIVDMPTILLWELQTSERFNKWHFINSSNTDFQDYMSLYKKCTAKLCSVLVIDTTLASDNPLRFTKNILERV